MRPKKGEMTCREALEVLKQMEQTPAIKTAIKIMATQIRQLDRERKGTIDEMLNNYYDEEQKFYDEWGKAIDEDTFYELCDTLVPDDEIFMNIALNDPEIAIYDTDNDTGAVRNVWFKFDKLKEFANKVKGVTA